MNTFGTRTISRLRHSNLPFLCYYYYLSSFLFIFFSFPSSMLGPKTLGAFTLYEGVVSDSQEVLLGVK